MHAQVLAGVLALAGSSFAFSDSSPWVLLSTSPLSSQPNTNQIQTSSDVLKYSKDILAACATDRYLVITQPGVNAADLERSADCAVPHLCQAAKDARIQGKFTVAEVVGDLKSAGMPDYIKAACERKGKTVTVEEVSLASLSGEDRAGILAENDEIVARSLRGVTADDSYTVLFSSSPREPTYEADFAEPLHMDTKRDTHDSSVRRQNDTRDDRQLPLFEKYQFFTPGIFMGIIVSLIIISILGVGIRAVSSLEVSYGAFEKEMGPTQQKKQH